MYTVPQPLADGSSSRQAYTDELCACGVSCGFSNVMAWKTVKTSKKTPKTRDAPHDAPHKNTYNRFWPLADASAEVREPAAKVARVPTQEPVKSNLKLCAPQDTSPTSSRCRPGALKLHASAGNILANAQ